MNKMLELSSCEYSSQYYEDVLWSMDKEITSLSIEVDRGVHFEHLRQVLKEFKLTCLTLNQNYADPSTTMDDFLLFIKELQLNYFILEDFQTPFLLQLKMEDLIKVAKKDSTIEITYDQCKTTYRF